jgi:glyoxylase-like metal-dependent hydrolase (beta-lactamase superfamily II)/rhodanese-related sulfurtransferase
VTVLDIREAEDRRQWWIPGSRHLDAYRSLKEGSAGPLLTADLPADRPVVTVCGSGRVSLTAAEALAGQRGIPALSLRGGMKAWSVAWNVASRRFGEMDVTQIRRTGKGCLSYLIRAGSSAAVIDPSIEPDVYLKLAEDSGASIGYVLDTHIHADHLSRGRRLAEASGAQLLVPRQNRVRYPHRPVEEGEKLAVGTAFIKVLSTPGHTDESATYLVPGAGIFTGDTLFLAGVGRPDLHAGRPESEARARQLFRSILRLLSLDPQLQVFPGHTSEPVSFDGDLLTASIGEVALRLGDWVASEDAFVSRILTRIPPAPPNYVTISQLNELGEWAETDPTDLEAGANRCAVR